MSGGEDEITAYFAGESDLPEEQFPIGIGDDMAQVRLSENSFLVTTDMLLDGVHFDLSKVSLEQAAYKAMLVSLSDCAAMATIPVAAVAAVAMPKEFGSEELKELHKGIITAGKKYGCELIGGDITKWKESGKFAINVTMFSRPGENKPIVRSGAKVGDVICVTGELGGSIKGKHLVFEPRVKEALKLTGLVQVNSMMDVSDGLSIDLKRICKASKVGAVIEAELIPISQEAKKSDVPLRAALNDGEDFELLFTLSVQEYEKLKGKWDKPLSITRIGEVKEGWEVLIKTADGNVEKLDAKGFDHLG